MSHGDSEADLRAAPTVGSAAGFCEARLAKVPTCSSWMFVGWLVGTAESRLGLRKSKLAFLGRRRP
jgi:hypothetical protein